jgi:hypothetical protein
MPKKTPKPHPKKHPKELPPTAKARGDRSGLKPAESAENFEHVLRRLVIARDRGKSNGG